MTPFLLRPQNLILNIIISPPFEKIALSHDTQRDFRFATVNKEY